MPLKLLNTKNNQKGQTMVEYVLLVAVVVAITLSLFGQLEDYLINNPDRLQNKYLRGYERVFNGNGVKGRYKFFSVFR